MGGLSIPAFIDKEDKSKTEKDVAKLRSLAEAQSDADATLVESGFGIGGLVERHHERFDAIHAWDEASENCRAGTVLAPLDRLEQAEAGAAHQAKRADANLNDMDAAIELAEHAEAAR